MVFKSSVRFFEKKFLTVFFLEKATGEGLVAENWALNFEICDKLNSSGEKG